MIELLSERSGFPFRVPGVRTRARYLSTVDLATEMPNFAPQRSNESPELGAAANLALQLRSKVYVESRWAITISYNGT